METIRILRRELAGKVPLIGFGGAPFTLAATWWKEKLEGLGKYKADDVYAPDVYAALMEKVTMMDMEYLNAQIRQAPRRSRSLTPGRRSLSRDYSRYVLPYTTKLINGLNRQNTPVIHFVKGAATMLDIVQQAGGDVMGLDWHVDLGKARDVLGSKVAVQGNLDPTVLFASKEIIEREVKRVLDENADRPGHIFNLGHGILPTVPPRTPSSWLSASTGCRRSRVMTARIADLEIQLTHQQRQVEELNELVYSQQQTLEVLTAELRQIKEQLQIVLPSPHERVRGRDAAPHY